MKAILIDDEELALNYLEHQLLNIGDFEIVGKFTDPMIGKREIEKNEIDIVFLDIQTPKLNGIELAEQLLEVKPQLQIVFVTAYERYAIKAFELNALDYVLKPVGKQRLQNTMKRIQSMMEEHKTFSPQKSENLQMSLFQQVTFVDGGQEIPLRWRTAKVQQLFLYLVQHRGTTVNKTAIIELLWPELEPEKAHHQLYTAIYHIRKTLAPFSEYFQISNTSEGYKVKLEQTILDVDQFERFFRSDLSLSAETIDEYEQAMALCKGDYLQEHNYIWAESERQRLQLQWVQTAVKMVDWYYANDEWDKAITLCLDICQRYPLEEEAYFFLMKIFADMDRHSSVHKQYDQLTSVLWNELQEQPNPAITEWYQLWKQKNKE
ncbi:response regulator receiver protein [Brevibacillus brevis]|uniref:response regulator n=1 Tax=Brevibacillus brevis TaxID=1393 RepID=UPI000B3A4FA4|nr:response regulator [Brevibacillus brevis]OUQ87021.1 response regulator receiver protein [Brevibacillus brevis]